MHSDPVSSERAVEVTSCSLVKGQSSVKTAVRLTAAIPTQGSLTWKLPTPDEKRGHAKSSKEGQVNCLHEVQRPTQGGVVYMEEETSSGKIEVIHLDQIWIVRTITLTKGSSKAEAFPANECVLISEHM